VLREEGTEPAFSGKYLKNKKNGIYVCAGCGNDCLIQTQNLILAQAGPVSGLQSPRITSKKKLITASECTEPR
jgi:hypothetical protein